MNNIIDRPSVVSSMSPSSALEPEISASLWPYYNDPKSTGTERAF